MNENKCLQNAPNHPQHDDWVYKRYCPEKMAVIAQIPAAVSCVHRDHQALWGHKGFPKQEDLLPGIGGRSFANQFKNASMGSMP